MVTWESKERIRFYRWGVEFEPTLQEIEDALGMYAHWDGVVTPNPAPKVPPLTSKSTPRPIAVIEAEIRRAVTPALRSEDV